VSDGSALDTWTSGTHTAGGVTHPTYRKGAGPGVVLIHEIPGITDNVIAFAEEVVAAGHTVVMPRLFGKVGGPAALRDVAGVMPALCVSKEFTKLAVNETSPVADWLRSLARALHAELGGPGVGALGMCFTGGFALAMMVDGSVTAPVLCQPSLPFAIGRRRSADLNLSPHDLDLVRRRAAEGCPRRWTGSWPSSRSGCTAEPVVASVLDDPPAPHPCRTWTRTAHRAPGGWRQFRGRMSSGTPPPSCTASTSLASAVRATRCDIGPNDTRATPSSA
jgi:hypothetical protein